MTVRYVYQLWHIRIVPGHGKLPANLKLQHSVQDTAIIAMPDKTDK